MATPARLAGVGVFVLGGLLLFAVGLFMIGDRQMAFAKKFTIYTEFKKITGLQPGGDRPRVRRQGRRDQDRSFRRARRAASSASSSRSPRTCISSCASTRSRRSKPRGSSAAAISASAAAPTRRPPPRPDATIPSKEPFEIADLMQQMGDTVEEGQRRRSTR